MAKALRILLGRKGLMGWVCLDGWMDIPYASTATLEKPYAQRK
jgi:hypothetical protein